MSPNDRSRPIWVGGSGSETTYFGASVKDSLNPQVDLAPYESALELAAERGWHVFPTDHPDLPQCAAAKTPDHDPVTCDKRGKHPVIKWDTGASTSPDNIHYWWSGNPRNVGIHTGKSGLLVIDEGTPPTSSPDTPPTTAQPSRTPTR